MKLFGKHLICALILCGLLTSCAGTETPVDTSSDVTTTTAEATDTELTPDLPDKTYDGYEFTFFMRDSDSHIKDMYAEEITGDLMNDVIYDRNAAVGDKYNVTFTYARGNSVASDADKAIMAGDDSYDVIIPHGRTAFTYAQAGLTLDWNTDLPYVDLDNPWWNQDARENFSFNNKLYTMTGDISYQNFGAATCMLFNKTIMDTYNMEYPYQTVIAGEWTFETFTTMAKSVISDLNGDTLIDYENDQIGYITQHWGGPTQVLYSADERICRKNEADEMYLTLNTERTIDVFANYFAFTDTDAAYIHLDSDYTSIEKAFSDGRALFFDPGIVDIEKFRSMKDDFGIIPWPKYDETIDKYYSKVGAGSNLICVPITASDPERTSVILEALCYEGYKTVIPTYYEVVLTSKYARDEESVAMLDLISEGRVYDIGYFYSNDDFVYQINSIGYFLAHEEDHGFSSFYAKYEAQALAKIEAINETYKD
ncbi:MAG: extracellular solute-binding protein [Clostridia bacterium]|nr:extracellular solute-binding protein [Clostridia bacterium]